MPRSRRSPRTSTACTDHFPQAHRGFLTMSLLQRTFAVLLAVLPLACSAGDGPFQPGKDYTELRAPQPKADPSKIEVMEVFAYSCPHCFHLEPEVEKWVKKKPADVNFVRLPHTL